MRSAIISVPKEFSYELSLQFLERSPKEVLHNVHDGVVTKLIKVKDQLVLFCITHEKDALHVDFVAGTIDDHVTQEVLGFITEWFDLATDLKPFYGMAKQDALLKDLVNKFYGYRIIGQPDLFESLVWAVLGQQINVQFAYTLKQRFVENFGDRFNHNDKDYYLFPTPAVVAQLSDAELLPLQFSRQKSKYVVLIAQAFTEGHISKENIKALPFLQAKEALMKIKGVGNWTANYALMKTFRHAEAFPLEDVAIHNAIKNLKGMKAKPTLDQVKRVFKKYKGWEAYATLYLWKSL
jgi:DNA-3-methyladenine glycosylase II